MLQRFDIKMMLTYHPKKQQLVLSSNIDKNQKYSKELKQPLFEILSNVPFLKDTYKNSFCLNTFQLTPNFACSAKMNRSLFRLHLTNGPNKKQEKKPNRNGKKIPSRHQMQTKTINLNFELIKKLQIQILSFEKIKINYKSFPNMQ